MTTPDDHPTHRPDLTKRTGGSSHDMKDMTGPHDMQGMKGMAGGPGRWPADGGVDNIGASAETRPDDHNRATKIEEITMMFWYGNGVNGWGYTLMAVSMIAFWGLVVAAVFYLVPSSPRRSGRPTPQQILAERFARGDITEEEYRQHLGIVHTDPPSLTKSHP